MRCGALHYYLVVRANLWCAAEASVSWDGIPVGAERVRAVLCCGDCCAIRGTDWVAALCEATYGMNRRRDTACHITGMGCAVRL